MRLRRGFTLLEVLVVLTLTAVLTTAVALSLSSAARRAQAEDVAGRLAHFDRVTRARARRFGQPLALVFDLNRGTVRATADAGEPDTAGDGPSLQLAAGYRVERVLLPGGAAVSGEVTVPVSARGQSPSYAVLLSAQGGRRWFVVAGLTGQMTEASNAQEAEQLFAALGGGGRGDDAR